MTTGFKAEALTDDEKQELTERRKAIAADILRLTSLAGSGHPGGSLSTLDALNLIYARGNFNPKEPRAVDRDRLVISHGHISPGVYGTLANYEFFPIQEAYRGFRKAGTVFGGHIEKEVPGVEWNTGNLGQGLSAGCGFAVANRARGINSLVFVGMGDGEQQKGQVSEARRFAAKFELSNLITFVDVNGLQIGGDTGDIMPNNLAASWEADGWNVLKIDGHDYDALYDAFRAAALRETKNPDAPTVLLLQTVMGKGVSSIEGDYQYHGQALDGDMLENAFEELGAESNMEELRADRQSHTSSLPHKVAIERSIDLDLGSPRNYEPSTVTDCRSAYGNALADLAKVNVDREGSWPILGFSCDLEGSTKMGGFHKATPDRFLEAGIAEHHTAVAAGAASTCGVVPFFSTFGMFGIVESYNQQRLNDQNSAAPKVVVTHCGLDVGADGPTHQCIDYIPLSHNLFGFELYYPADPNECDRIIRTVATRYKPTIVAMGRSKLHPIANEDGEPAFGGGFKFEPGVWHELRGGDDITVIAYGPMVYRAVNVSDQLRDEGIDVRVINASSLKPIDEQAILRAADETGKIVTYEDHNVHTGLGAMVCKTLGSNGVAAKVIRMGVSKYGTSGNPDDLFAEQGLAPTDLADRIRNAAKG
jgi:transketolase